MPTGAEAGTTVAITSGPFRPASAPSHRAVQTPASHALVASLGQHARRAGGVAAKAMAVHAMAALVTLAQHGDAGALGEVLGVGCPWAGPVFRAARAGVRAVG